MTGFTDIQLDRDNANDEESVVVAVHAQSGAGVKAEDPLFDVENSKATQEILAPVAGIVVHRLVVGDKLPFGVPVARIMPPGTNDLAAAMPTLKQAPQAAQESPPLAVVAPSAIFTGKPRFSHAAAALAARHGLTEQDFARALVTAKDVEALVGGAKPAKSMSALPRHSAGADVLPRKREEIKSLERGAGNTMLSILGAKIGRIEIKRDDGDFFSGKITDLVAFESARLMRKYPKLNAAWHEGSVRLHEAVHAGIAFDEGEHLVVYGIADADRKDLHALRAEIEDALVRYVERKLTSAEITRATFTITDLSSANLDFIFPLLPEGQSCILGITRNSEGEFSLYVGFDHRVTEGLKAANFLDELCQRVMSFARDCAPSPRCSFCDKSAGDEIGAFRGRGLLKIVDAHGGENLACHSCWSGW